MFCDIDVTYLLWCWRAHTCVDIIPSLDDDEHTPVLTSYPAWMMSTHLCWRHILPRLLTNTLCWGHTLPGCWRAHTIIDVIPSLDVDEHIVLGSYLPWMLTGTYLYWCHTLLGCWRAHTFIDVIPSLDADEHIPVLTSYPPWMLTSTLPQMYVWPAVTGMWSMPLSLTGVTVKPSTWPEKWKGTGFFVWSLLAIIANSDIPHDLEFDNNQEAMLVRGARPLIKFN